MKNINLLDWYNDILNSIGSYVKWGKIYEKFVKLHAKLDEKREEKNLEGEDWKNRIKKYLKIMNILEN